MAKRKTGLTVERHRAIGAQGKAMRGVLVDLACEPADAYPVNHGQYNSAERAWKRIDTLRAYLAEAMFIEHHDEASPSVYYQTPGA